MGVFSLEWAFDSEGERAGSRATNETKILFPSQYGMYIPF
jgi:uncharacterized NAD-dependent epimerase/dehydratase family protein